MNTGKFYDGYEKLKTVGQGAFGIATLYRRKEDGQQVVMKEIYLADMDESEKRSALNEVEILSTLTHPNIIKYLGNFQREGSLIIVMEYADGGNLAQLINVKKNKSENFTEKSILNIMTQIVSAISYMHEHKILHRDLKTANIFLNVNSTIKIGDFGISKMLNTRSQAQTVVGTPYYLSPEMCEGHDYNEKSDIWAIGCILYELACLRKPFEALTLPVLVQKILSCEYNNIPEVYSEDLARFVHSMLQKNPELRPSAKYIYDNVIPRINKNMKASNSSTQSSTSINKLRERSILYQIQDFGDHQKMLPIDLPHKKIIDYDVSAGHHIIVTSDNFVYTWGENHFGQLGFSEQQVKSKQSAACAHSLKEKLIKQCAAGKSFSIFLSTEGALYSCGDGRQGCLGHGDWANLAEPKIISSLIQVKIEQICCGDGHVVALSNEGKVYTWGSSKRGQLGQGHMQLRCKPFAIKLTNNSSKIKNIYCGTDSTFLLSENGQVLVSGDNAHGKLGIADKDQIYLFTAVTSLKETVQSISVGSNHTVVLTETGKVICLGKHTSSIKIKNKIKIIAAGMNFTVAGDHKNVLWFWGESAKAVKEFNDNSDSPLQKSISPLIKKSQDETTIIKKIVNDRTVRETIKIPRPILALYSSPSNVDKGNVIYLGNVKAVGKSLFLLVHTTAPAPIREYTNSNEFHTSNYAIYKDETTYAPAMVVTDLPNTARII